MGRSGVIRMIIETEEDVAWETRRLAQRIHRMLNPELFPDEPPAPAVCAIDSLRDLTAYPVQRRRIGIPGPPNEPIPPPPDRTISSSLALCTVPSRMRAPQMPGPRRFRPPPLNIDTATALPSIAESSSPVADLMNQTDKDSVPDRSPG